MPKTYDLGQKRRTESVAPFHVGRDETYYETCSISSEQFPPIKDWKIGQEYTVTFTLKQTGARQQEAHIRGEFEVRKATMA